MSDHTSYGEELADVRNMAADLDGFSGEYDAASGGLAETDHMTYQLDTRQDTAVLTVEVEDRFPETVDAALQEALTQRGYAQRTDDDGYVVHEDPGMDEPYLEAWTEPGDEPRSTELYIEGDHVLDIADDVTDILDR